MHVREILFLDCSERIHISEIEIVRIGALKDGCPFCCIQKFPFLIQQLQGIPLFRIMRSCQDDSSVRLLENHCHLCGRSRRKTGLDYIHSTSYEASAYKLLHHFSRDSGILADNDLVSRVCRLWASFAKFYTVCISEFNNVNRCESIPWSASDCSSDSRN